MNNLESGLYLPIRFYAEQSEQDRHKRHSLGVSLTELNYPYVDCTSLAPFQVSFMSPTVASEILLYAKCADTDELISLTLQPTDYHEIVNSDGIYYFSYLGSGNFAGDLNNGLYYLVIVIVVGEESNNFYSDLFMIKNCADAEPYDIGEYRAFVSGSQIRSDDNLRAIDTTDLRITKK